MAVTYPNAGPKAWPWFPLRPTDTPVRRFAVIAPLGLAIVGGLGFGLFADAGLLAIVVGMVCFVIAAAVAAWQLRRRHEHARLGYANARIANGGNEVGQIALARELEALGQGALGNDQSLLAALSVSRQNAQIARARAQRLRGQQPTMPAPIADANRGAAPATAGPPAGVAPELWNVMTPEEKALFQ
jgi:hypothetical protein